MVLSSIFHVLLFLYCMIEIDSALYRGPEEIFFVELFVVFRMFATQ